MCKFRKQHCFLSPTTRLRLLTNKLVAKLDWELNFSRSIMLSTALEVQSRHLASALLHLMKEILGRGLSQPSSRHPLDWTNLGATGNGRYCGQHESSQTVIIMTKDGDVQMQKELVRALWTYENRVTTLSAPVVGNQPTEWTLNAGRVVEQLDRTKRDTCIIYLLICVVYWTLYVAGTGVAYALCTSTIRSLGVSIIAQITVHSNYVISSVIFI